MRTMRVGGSHRIVDRQDGLPHRRVVRALPFFHEPLRLLLEARAVIDVPHLRDALAQRIVVLARGHRVDEVAVEGRERRTQRDQPGLLRRGVGRVAEMQLLVVQHRVADEVLESHVILRRVEMCAGRSQ
jgi:hypothetical protein